MQLLKHANWSEQLLAQELCEELSMCVVSDAETVMAGAAEMFGRPPESPRTQNLMRGASANMPAGRMGDGHGILRQASTFMPLPQSVLIFRGLRLKVGLDLGQVRIGVGVTGV